MTTIEPLERLRERTIVGMGDAAALDHISTLIDASGDAGFAKGADRAIFLLDELAKRDLDAVHGATAEYFRANAWALKEEVAGEKGSWAWEHPEREHQLLALSRAATHPGFPELSTVRRCQILTNRGNQLNTTGRFIDAVESWDRAIAIIPRFAMAQANRGYGLKHYGGLLEDDRDRAFLLASAHGGFVDATTTGAVYDAEYPASLSRRFASEAEAMERYVDLARVRAMQDENPASLGKSEAERRYRRWCLDLRLFLNPLNDIGGSSDAANDGLVLPAILERFDERPGAFTPPPIIGFFNQMKQEYASARFMLFEGLQDTALHFSDRRVSLFDTLDYPMHSLATERVRTAYRIAYSLLDKIAYLVDHYWKLGKHPDRINFRNVWMVEGKSRLHARFENYPNWPLRGLFWLSKDLFDDRLKHTTGPDARELHDIRNALEHKFLQVHEGWAAAFQSGPPNSDGLGISIDSDLLEAKAIRVMKIVRAALIQVVMAIGVEERRFLADDDETVVGTMSLATLDDRRKRRDPT